jgi:hydrogenase/urease accessory protein HupE
VSRRSLALAAGVGLLLWPEAAQAHLMTTGLGPVYDGISHLVLTFEDLLPVLAMAVLAGLNGPAAGRRVLIALPVSWLAGGLAGFAWRAPLLPPGVAALSLLIVGGLAALDRRLAPNQVAGLALALGLVHGWLNGAGIASAGREAMGLIGIVGAIFVLTALLSAWIASLRQPWTRVVARVAGSWTAAIGLLMLGWTLSGRS